MIPTEIDLSEREREIIRLVATGASNKQIAQDLFISTNTVKVHLRNIFAKIGVTSRTEATLYAIREGLVAAPGAKSEASSPEGDVISVDLREKNASLDDVVGTPPKASPYRIMSIGVVFFALVVVALLLVRQWTSNGQPANAPSTSIQKWDSLPALPSARSRSAAAAYENDLFVIGGMTAQGVSGDVLVYSTDTKKWKESIPKTTPVADASACMIGGKIYVPGGLAASKQPTDIVEVFDPIAEKWDQRAKLPSPISGYALADLDGKLYLFGGWNGSEYLKTVYEYNPDSNNWTRKADMPTARANAGAAVISGKIFVIGGTDGIKALEANEAYSPELDNGKANAWETRRPAPEGRYSMGVEGLLDMIYLVGGKSDHAGKVSELVYLNQQDTWGILESKPDELGWNIGLVGLNNRLYILGGEKSSGITDQVLAFQAIYTIAIPNIINQ